MSLILDALKRAERERRSDGDAAPPEVAVPTATAPRARRPWRLIAGAVAAVGVVVAAGLAWQKLRQQPAPAAPEQAAAAPPATPPVIMARPAPPDPEAQTPAVVPGTEGVASLDDLTDEPVLEAEPLATAPVPAVPPPTPAPTAHPEIKTTPYPPPQAVTPSAPPAPAPAQPPAAAPSDPAAAEPPAEIPPALTMPAPLRKFREMPPDYRADFPALKVEIHVYEKTPQRRFVMINGRKYREGERLGEGPALVEIVPEGLVLEYRGEKVLYTLSR